MTQRRFPSSTVINKQENNNLVKKKNHISCNGEQTIEGECVKQQQANLLTLPSLQLPKSYKTYVLNILAYLQQKQPNPITKDHPINSTTIPIICSNMTAIYETVKILAFLVKFQVPYSVANKGLQIVNLLLETCQFISYQACTFLLDIICSRVLKPLLTLSLHCFTLLQRIKTQLKLNQLRHVYKNNINITVLRLLSNGGSQSRKETIKMRNLLNPLLFMNICKSQSKTAEVQIHKRTIDFFNKLFNGKGQLMKKQIEKLQKLYKQKLQKYSCVQTNKKGQQYSQFFICLLLQQQKRKLSTPNQKYLSPKQNLEPSPTKLYSELCHPTFKSLYGLLDSLPQLDTTHLFRTLDPILTYPLNLRLFQILEKEAPNLSNMRVALRLVSKLIEWGDLEAYMNVVYSEQLQKFAEKLFKIRGYISLKQGRNIFPQLEHISKQQKIQYYKQFLKFIKLFTICRIKQIDEQLPQNQLGQTQQNCIKIRKIYYKLESLKYIFPQQDNEEDSPAPIQKNKSQQNYGIDNDRMLKNVYRNFENNIRFNQERNQIWFKKIQQQQIHVKQSLRSLSKSLGALAKNKNKQSITSNQNAQKLDANGYNVNKCSITSQGLYTVKNSINSLTNFNNSVNISISNRNSIRNSFALVNSATAIEFLKIQLQDIIDKLEQDFYYLKQLIQEEKTRIDIRNKVEKERNSMNVKLNTIQPQQYKQIEPIPLTGAQNQKPGQQSLIIGIIPSTKLNSIHRKMIAVKRGLQNLQNQLQINQNEPDQQIRNCLLTVTRNGRNTTNQITNQISEIQHWYENMVSVRNSSIQAIFQASSYKIGYQIQSMAHKNLQLKQQDKNNINENDAKQFVAMKCASQVNKKQMMMKKESQTENVKNTIQFKNKLKAKGHNRNIDEDNSTKENNAGNSVSNTYENIPKTKSSPVIISPTIKNLQPIQSKSPIFNNQYNMSHNQYISHNNLNNTHINIKELNNYFSQNENLNRQSSSKCKKFSVHSKSSHPRTESGSRARISSMQKNANVSGIPSLMLSTNQFKKNNACATNVNINTTNIIINENYYANDTSRQKPLSSTNKRGTRKTQLKMTQQLAKNEQQPTMIQKSGNMLVCKNNPSLKVQQLPPNSIEALLHKLSLDKKKDTTYGKTNNSNNIVDSYSHNDNIVISSHTDANFNPAKSDNIINQEQGVFNQIDINVKHSSASIGSQDFIRQPKLRPNIQSIQSLGVATLKPKQEAAANKKPNFKDCIKQIEEQYININVQSAMAYLSAKGKQFQQRVRSRQQGSEHTSSEYCNRNSSRSKSELGFDSKYKESSNSCNNASHLNANNIKQQVMEQNSISYSQVNMGIYKNIPTMQQNNINYNRLRRLKSETDLKQEHMQMDINFRSKNNSNNKNNNSKHESNDDDIIIIGYGKVSNKNAYINREGATHSSNATRNRSNTYKDKDASGNRIQNKKNQIPQIYRNEYFNVNRQDINNMNINCTLDNKQRMSHKNKQVPQIQYYKKQTRKNQNRNIAVQVSQFENNYDMVSPVSNKRTPIKSKQQPQQAKFRAVSGNNQNFKNKQNSFYSNSNSYKAVKTDGKLLQQIGSHGRNPEQASQINASKKKIRVTLRDNLRLKQQNNCNQRGNNSKLYSQSQLDDEQSQGNKFLKEPHLKTIGQSQFLSQFVLLSTHKKQRSKSKSGAAHQPLDEKKSNQIRDKLIKQYNQRYR